MYFGYSTCPYPSHAKGIASPDERQGTLLPSRVAIDPLVRRICKEILANGMGIESIILTGSVALRDDNPRYSDYDFVVVVNSLMAPIVFRRMRMVELKLNKVEGINVSIGPLPFWRSKRARGNYFLHKLRRNGVTIWGRDILGELEVGDMREISSSWHVSYLATQANRLLGCVSIRKDGGLETTSRDKVTYYAARGIIACAEILLLRKGIYAPRVADQVRFLSDLRTSMNPQILMEMEKIKNCPEESAANWIQLWVQARRYLLQLFIESCHSVEGGPEETLHELCLSAAENYLCSGSPVSSIARDLQFLSLSLMTQHIPPLKPLVSGNVKKIFQTVALLLLSSIDNEGIDEKSLKKVESLLGISSHGDPQHRWLLSRKYLSEFFVLANAHMGV